MALTKIGSIGINTGIQFAGVTTIATLNASDNVLSVGGTVNFVSDVSIGGSVSIGGTLTYEDVTNIDSVGLITARNGIVVGSGITLSSDGDIFATGVTTTGSLVSNGKISATSFVQIGAVADTAEAPLHVTAENSNGINAIFGAKDFVTSANYNYDDANIALQGRDADDNDTGAGIQFTVRNTGDTNWLHGAITMDQSNNYIFKNGGAGNTVGTEKLRITSGGLLGIGTDTILADSKLHIHDATAGNYRSVVIDSHATNGSTLIYKQNGSQVLSIGSGGGNNLSGSNLTHGLIRSEVMTIFAVGNNERLRIDSSGNLALGTQVNAGDTLRYFDVANYNTGSSAGSIVRLLTTKSDGTGAVGLDIVKYKSGGAYLNNYETIGTNGFIAFGTGTGGGSVATRLKIESDGKLFIDRTHASATTGEHPALDIDTYANGTAGATFGTGIDFRVAGVHKKRLTITNADSSAGTGDWVFYRDNGSNVGMKISSAGYVTTPSTVTFQAYGGTNTAAGNYIIFTNTNWNDGGGYNTSNGIFTAPVAGTYLFTITGLYTANTATPPHKVVWHVNNANQGVLAEWQDGSISNSYNTIGNSSIIYKLSANDTMRVYVEASTAHISGGQTRYCGHLLG